MHCVGPEAGQVEWGTEPRIPELFSDVGLCGLHFHNMGREWNEKVEGMDKEGVGVSKGERGGWYLGNSEPYIFLTGQGVMQPQVMGLEDS